MQTRLRQLASALLPLQLLGAILPAEEPASFPGKTSDGHDLAQLPEKPVGRFGRPRFQAMSYHDTPERPLPELRFVDKTAEKDKAYEYRVVAFNSVGFKSETSEMGMVK